MKARPSVEKRRKERARQERQQEKVERREQRKGEKTQKDDGTGVDPDIAHIVPGPQPHPFYDDET